MVFSANLLKVKYIKYMLEGEEIWLLQYQRELLPE